MAWRACSDRRRHGCRRSAMPACPPLIGFRSSSEHWRNRRCDRLVQCVLPIFRRRNMSIFNSRAAIAVIAAFFATACFAQAEKAAPLTPEAAGIKKALEQKFPGAEVKGVVKTTYLGGLYEVQLD